MIRRVPADPDEHGCPYLVGGIYQKKLRGVEGRPSFRVTALPELQRLGDVTRTDVLAEGGFNGTRALSGLPSWIAKPRLATSARMSRCGASNRGDSTSAITSTQQ